MKKFIQRLLIILIILIVADRALSYFVRHLYKTTTTTDEYKINTVMLKMKEPVIFMGSSRAHHHYIPAIISDTLKKGVYNAGLWGMRNIYFQYAFLSNILERYTPETICLEIHPIDYLATPFSDIDKASNLNPFINYSPGCDEILKKAGSYYKSKISVLFRYNSLFANIIIGNLTQRTLASDLGFKGLSGELDIKNSEIKPEKFPFPIDVQKVNYLQAFIEKCKDKKINLIFLYSPMYAVEKTNLFDFPTEIARKNNIPFLNHYQLEGITGHAEYYYDYGHLNVAGAKKYSAVIAAELKQYIKKK